MSRERLLDLGARIETLSTHPEAVEGRWLTALARPLLRRFAWRPRFQTAALRGLLAAVSVEGARQAAATRQLAEEAIEELEANVRAAERACVIHRRLPIAHAAWLHRLHQVVARATRAASDEADAEARRLARSIDPVMVLPPLGLAPVDDDDDDDDDDDGAGRGAAREPRPAPAPPPLPQGQQALLDLELAAVDHLLDAARAERELLGRRQRLLEAARQLLLETSAALPLEPSGAEARRRYIAEEITRIDRIVAAGVSPEIGLLHQARAALQRGERQRLHAALIALDGAAVSVGDGRVAGRTGEALSRLWGDGDRHAARAQAASLARSAGELFGDETLDAVEEAYRAARSDLPRSARDLDPTEREKLLLSKEYLKPKNEAGTVSALVASGGAFEVGGALSPVRVVEHELRARAVAFPTPDLALLPAHDVADVVNAVIDDPRAILMNLAQGRLLTRRFTAIESRPRSRTVMVGQARVYVLDGSGSMHVTVNKVPGARARVRDAILLAELATLRARLEDPGRSTRVVLFYRYFNDAVGLLHRVATGDEALAAMHDVAASIRVGGTDIEAALTASFDQVREARGEDPELGSAQIVLITDGEARVREELIDEARRGLEDLPIGVSVIALGQENPALRGIVARQRAKGERAFYHHLGDEALVRMATGAADRGVALHLPDDPEDARRSPDERARLLEETLGGLLDDLADLDRARHVEAIEAAEAHTQALAEVGLDPARSRGEGERAHTLARARDRRALEACFARWFPRAPADGPPPAAPLPGTPERDDLDAALVALAVVAEVVSEVAGSPLARRADAIDLLERLLPDARLSPSRYASVLRSHAPSVAPALEAVHRAVGALPAA